MHDFFSHAAEHLVDAILATICGLLLWLLERRSNRREALEKQRAEEREQLEDRLKTLEAAHNIEFKPKRKTHKDHS